MTESLDSDGNILKRLNLNSELVINNNEIEECEAAEETLTTDSEEYLSMPMRYQNIQYSTSSNDSEVTLTAINHEDDDCKLSRQTYLNNLQIPIVGYEVMEERAKFTVFKLRIENKSSGDCWYVFRRYTDFVRLCSKIRHSFPHVVQNLPRKRWLGNNFDPIFLEERLNGLQTLVNAILNEPNLVQSQLLEEFFCLNEPPVYSETNEESRAMFEALEDTIYQLKQQIHQKETIIDALEESLHSSNIENENLKKIINNSTANCPKCQKDCENIKDLLE